MFLFHFLEIKTVEAGEEVLSINWSVANNFT
jgi:hypothetical protein